MPSYDYDLLIIGSGPAGEGAALHAAKLDQRVCMIEEQHFVGGNCTHKGTIPSKALRQAVRRIIQFNTLPMFRDVDAPQIFGYPKVLKQAERVIRKQVKLRTEMLARNGVKVITGVASFVDGNTVDVLGESGIEEKITAKNFLIATGSRPYHPAHMDFNHPRVFCSDSILHLNNTPKTLIVYGAGVIGCEYASIFAGLGVHVDLINTRSSLLEFLDDEISDALGYHLRDMGVNVRHNEEEERLEVTDDGVTLFLASGKRLRGDAILFCNGRTGNTINLNLEAVGLKANHRGQISVDESYCTEVDNIYGAGDVIGWPALASAAYDQGRSAAAAMLGGEQVRFVNDVPTGIYTLPEISSIGKTESELTAARIPYEVGRAFFKNIARAQITGDEVGMLKLLFHVDTLEILGVHSFGPESSEIIHIGQAVMNQPGDNNSIEYFVNSTFNYPTMAEAYRVAALEGLERVGRLND
ncbi:Si-specific NAD(P)(+) transhydrogenase [uncultured Umboniibacter sp.]|uniref:Si-specific NAD(P)(+) transhydrogenase n=1 Tax=uncultured Umboniibacter sp. TaxID=1798917 RepID=UPI0026190FD2|nr:Si-specific NAD(P)(+) transhydrogenase [uncultured Umboniibacter sp.]